MKDREKQQSQVTIPLPMKERLRGWVFYLLSLLLLSSCYPTSNLPEDEVLYTGISEIAYNRKQRRASK